MEQFEKVCKGLECCKRSGQTIKPRKCEECPYKDDSILDAYTIWQTCKNKLADNALSLIRQQRERIAELEAELGQRDYNAAVEMQQYCERYEPTNNPEDGSM